MAGLHAAVMRADLRIPSSGSLKAKRRVLKSLIARLSTPAPVAVAEVDHQDLWQRATLGIAAVAPQEGQVIRLLHVAERTIRESHEVELLGTAIEHCGAPE